MDKRPPRWFSTGLHHPNTVHIRWKTYRQLPVWDKLTMLLLHLLLHNFWFIFLYSSEQVLLQRCCFIVAGLT